MSSLYQPPPIPGTTGTLSQGHFAPTQSPYFTVANQFLPRNLHDVIRWSKYITFQSPVIMEVLRKYATYPITDFIVETRDAMIKEKYNEVFAKFRMKPSLHDIGFEYHSIGNVFLSIYFPIHRQLVCPHCNTSYSAKTANFVKFENFQFKGTCPKCSSTNTKFIVKDHQSRNIQEMNLVKWDPLNIDVNHNPITNEYEYYYSIPNEIKRRIMMGDRLFVNSVPWGFIEAVRRKEDFKFDPGNIFHMRNMSAGHQLNGISVPPLISLYGLVFYQATLRKANESISTDFMNPLRVIYPAAQTGNSDPVMAISMQNFAANMQANLIRHKRDKNHIMVAPVPIGYQAISGEGKNLLVSQEIQQAEESILLALGVSRELLAGVTNWTSSTVGLRLLENTLLCYTSQIEELINWVMTKVSSYLSIEATKVSLTPFKLSDDDQLRQMLLNIFIQGKQQETPDISRETVYEILGIDADREEERIIRGVSRDTTAKIKADLEAKKAAFLAARETAEEFDKSGDLKTAIQQAQAAAQQILNMPPEQQREVLNQLEVQDYSLFMMTMHYLEQYQEQDQLQAQQEREQVMMEGEENPLEEQDNGKSGAPSSTKSPKRPTGPKK